MHEAKRKRTWERNPTWARGKYRRPPSKLTNSSLFFRVDNKLYYEAIMLLVKGVKMFRYVVIEYAFEDDSYYAKGKLIGAYENLKDARKATGEYIKANVKQKRKQYRDWKVVVRKETVFFPIRD